MREIESFHFSQFYKIVLTNYFSPDCFNIKFILNSYQTTLMKKNSLFVILIVLLFLTVSSVLNAHSLSINKSPIRPPRIHVYIDFGRYPACNRMNGICSISSFPEDEKVFNYPSAGGYGTYENSFLTLEIMENEMSDQLINEFKVVQFLPLDIPLVLNPEIFKRLMVPLDASIEIGRYPISKIEGGYRISLSVK